MSPDHDAASRGGHQREHITVKLDIDVPSEQAQAREWLDAVRKQEPVLFRGKTWHVENYDLPFDQFDRFVVVGLISTTQEPKGTSMSDPVVNKSLAVFLLETPGLRAVNVTYEGFDPSTKKPLGNLTMFKTFERDLTVGDLVIVPTGTRVGFTCVQIAELDPEIDFESSKEVGWIVGLFDISRHATILAQEQKIIDAVKAADKKARQDELKKRMLGNVDPKDLPVVDLKAITQQGDGAA